MLMIDFANTNYTNSDELFDELRTCFGSNAWATCPKELCTNKIKDNLMMVIMTVILRKFMKAGVSKTLSSKFI